MNILNVSNADDLWTSELYNETWSAPGNEKNYETDKIIQDFSYAGYRKGEEDIPPKQDESTFNVLHFGADPSGKKDSTYAIQKAIDAASVDGGIVFFPQGIYHVQPAPESTSALIIQASNVILRGEGIGKTRLLNTSTKMRQKSVISVQGTGSSWHEEEQTPMPISADLTGPTKRIPVENAAGFKEGDWVVLRADITKEWVLEHGVKKWLSVLDRLSGFSYFRQITRVDKENNALEIDIPIRYFLKKRDGARVYHKTKVLSGVGIEHLSLGNIENPSKEGLGQSGLPDGGNRCL